VIPCNKWGKSAAGTYRCHSVSGKCDEETKECPMKKQTVLEVD
jgi:hypothetical protein